MVMDATRLPNAAASAKGTPLARAQANAALLLSPAPTVSIGPVTSGALRERGLEPDVEASRHDIDGLLEALVADAATSRS